MSKDHLVGLRRAFDTFSLAMWNHDAGAKLRIALEKASDFLESYDSDSQTVAANLLITHSRQFGRRVRTRLDERPQLCDDELISRLVELTMAFDATLANYPIEQREIREILIALLTRSIRSLPSSYQDEIIDELRGFRD